MLRRRSFRLDAVHTRRDWAGVDRGWRFKEEPLPLSTPALDPRSREWAMIAMAKGFLDGAC